jgi:hypothetical protein
MTVSVVRKTPHTESSMALLLRVEALLLQAERLSLQFDQHDRSTIATACERLARALRTGATAWPLEDPTFGGYDSQ